MSQIIGMNFNPYKDELYNPLWLDKMEAIFQRDEYRCVICGFPVMDKRRYRFGDRNERELEIHFRQYLFNLKQNKYVAPWNYEDKLLITFCSWCHYKGNKLFRIPVKKII